MRRMMVVRICIGLFNFIKLHNMPSLKRQCSFPICSTVVHALCRLA